MGLTLEGTVFGLDPLDSRCWCQEQEILIHVKFLLYTYLSFIITVWQIWYTCQYIFEKLFGNGFGKISSDIHSWIVVL